jgi:hypothetical protein
MSIACNENPDEASVAAAKQWPTWECKPSKYALAIPRLLPSALPTNSSQPLIVSSQVPMELLVDRDGLCLGRQSYRDARRRSAGRRSSFRLCMFSSVRHLITFFDWQVQIKAGGMYTFPKGMSCTWEVCSQRDRRTRMRPTHGLKWVQSPRPRPQRALQMAARCCAWVGCSSEADVCGVLKTRGSPVYVSP